MKKLIYESAFPVFGYINGCYMHQDIEIMIDLPIYNHDMTHTENMISIIPPLIDSLKRNELDCEEKLQNLAKELEVLIPNFEQYAEEIIEDSDLFVDKDVLLVWLEGLHDYLKNMELGHAS